MSIGADVDNQSVIVKAFARLHLGLVKTPAQPGFMAAGLSLAAPSLEISVSLAPAGGKPKMSGEERIASSILGRIGNKKRARVEILRALPAHHGFGSGTRLALAACAGALALAGERMEVMKMAKLAGRGARSAMGAVLFEQGGVVVDLGGDILRAGVPSDWRAVLIFPEIRGEGHGFYGQAENEGINIAASCSAAMRNRLQDAGVEGIIKGAVSGDFDDFSQGVELFQAQAVKQFGPIQGGAASSENGRQILRWLKKEGVKPCGQSSWGPALFAITPSADEARSLTTALKKTPGIRELKVVKMANHGHRLTLRGL